MKKLIILTILSGLMITGEAFGQDRPVSDKQTDRVTDFRIPRGVRDNVDIRECSAAYREAQAAFRASFSGFREALAAATEEEKDAIKQRIRALMKERRVAQRDFRKKVRRILRGLREDRAVSDAG